MTKKNFKKRLTLSGFALLVGLASTSVEAKPSQALIDEESTAGEQKVAHVARKEKLPQGLSLKGSDLSNQGCFGACLGKLKKGSDELLAFAFHGANSIEIALMKAKNYLNLAEEPLELLKDNLFILGGIGAQILGKPELEKKLTKLKKKTTDISFEKQIDQLLEVAASAKKVIHKVEETSAFLEHTLKNTDSSEVKEFFAMLLIKVSQFDNTTYVTYHNGLQLFTRSNAKPSVQIANLTVMKALKSYRVSSVVGYSDEQQTIVESWVQKMYDSKINGVNSVDKDIITTAMRTFSAFTSVKLDEKNKEIYYFTPGREQIEDAIPLATVRVPHNIIEVSQGYTRLRRSDSYDNLRNLEQFETPLTKPFDPLSRQNHEVTPLRRNGNNLMSPPPEEAEPTTEDINPVVVEPAPLNESNGSAQELKDSLPKLNLLPAPEAFAVRETEAGAPHSPSVLDTDLSQQGNPDTPTTPGFVFPTENAEADEAENGSFSNV